MRAVCGRTGGSTAYRRWPSCRSRAPRHPSAPTRRGPAQRRRRSTSVLRTIQSPTGRRRARGRVRASCPTLESPPLTRRTPWVRRCRSGPSPRDSVWCRGAPTMPRPPWRGHSREPGPHLTLPLRVLSSLGRCRPSRTPTVNPNPRSRSYGDRSRELHQLLLTAIIHAHEPPNSSR
jgi:hypothetical protein